MNDFFLNSKIQICSLASGSKGNCLYIGFNDKGILIDAGLSGVEIEYRMESRGLSPDKVVAIMITHEHTDHVRGAGVLSRRFGIPLYMTESTHASCRKAGKLKQLELFSSGDSFDIDELKINTFSISHDAADPVGYTVEYENLKIGIATDLGTVTENVRENLRGSSLLYIESNHDPEMLINGSYPLYLKEKIRSQRGHLSNIDTGELISDIMDDRLVHVILAHLSQENNCPEKAREEVSKVLSGTDVVLHVAKQSSPGEIISL